MRTPSREACQSDLPIEWVDDKEWNAIEEVFDAVAKRSVDWQTLPRICSGTSPVMLPSMLPASNLAGHRSTLGCPRIHPGATHCQKAVGSNGGVSQWRTAGSPSQILRNVCPTGRARPQAIAGSSEFPSNDVTAEEQAGMASAVPEHSKDNATPGVWIQETGVSRSLREEFSVQDAAEGISGKEMDNQKSKAQSARRLPPWMEKNRFSALPLDCRSAGPRGGSESEADRTRDRESSWSEAGEMITSMDTGPKVWLQSEVQEQAGLPRGLEFSRCVDEVKPKFPTMQFRGQIVYSKTEGEVHAAALELWERIRELQQTSSSVIPMGFDLEWKPSFERGEVPRKVAVMQLCVECRRCYVMHIIYSGIPSSLQDLLEAPFTLKVGVGIHGDASKLHHDYQISTSKVVDLREVAHEKMKIFRKWSLSSLALELTGMQVEKIKGIRCGDWEALPLSQQQLQYAATDAFASLRSYQVLTTIPNTAASESNEDVSTNDVEPPPT